MFMKNAFTLFVIRLFLYLPLGEGYSEGSMQWQRFLFSWSVIIRQAQVSCSVKSGFCI